MNTAAELTRADLAPAGHLNSPFPDPPNQFSPTSLTFPQGNDDNDEGSKKKERKGKKMKKGNEVAVTSPHPQSSPPEPSTPSPTKAEFYEAPLAPTAPVTPVTSPPSPLRSVSPVPDLSESEPITVRSPIRVVRLHELFQINR